VDGGDEVLSMRPVAFAAAVVAIVVILLAMGTVFNHDDPQPLVPAPATTSVPNT
jgi:hypothetical protein